MEKRAASIDRTWKEVETVGIIHERDVSPKGKLFVNLVYMHAPEDPIDYRHIIISMSVRCAA